MAPNQTMLDVKQNIHRASGEVMGGPWQIRHVPFRGVDPETVAAAALDALRLVDRQMSTYRPDSDLMQVNNGPVGEWLSIPQDVHQVMSCANDIARRTDCALNIALGKLVNAWGFGPDDTPDCTPEIAAQRASAALAAIGSFALRRNPPLVRKDAKVSFDLSALAKGFAVDQAAAAVRSLGVKSFLIEAAGEVYAIGARPDGSGWCVGLELPVPGKITIFDHLTLDDMAAATTGGYRNLREIEGKTYNHTINPLTGFPIDCELLSVTVVHQSCMQADALATALYVLGEEAGPRFAQNNGIIALFMIRDGLGFREIRSSCLFPKATNSEQFLDNAKQVALL